MGPLEVAAGAAALLIAVVVGSWLVASRRRRNLRRRDEMEHGADDAALRAEVLRRLEREAAHWDDTAGPAPAARTTGAEPAQSPPAARSEVRPDDRPEVCPDVRPEVAPVAEPARHGRPGRRISVRWHPRA
jgi:hypothetical protein